MTSRSKRRIREREVVGESEKEKGGGGNGASVVETAWWRCKDCRQRRLPNRFGGQRSMAGDGEPTAAGTVGMVASGEWLTDGWASDHTRRGNLRWTNGQEEGR
ncbi:hypothetical protein NL676_019404 [Syzygium grande]|nr:hypothetical protein NL676_019404 [Syzygium grande]